MARLIRKTLMVEAEKIRELAERRGVSESAAVREAVDVALLADELAADGRGLPVRHRGPQVDFALLADALEAAMLDLSAAGGIAAAFGKLPVDSSNDRGERPQQ